MTGSVRGQSVIRVISGKMALNHRNPNWVLGSWWGCLPFSPSPGGRWALKDSPPTLQKLVCWLPYCP